MAVIVQGAGFALDERYFDAEEAARHLDDAFAVLDEIGNRIVASIGRQIELAERNRAQLKPPTRSMPGRRTTAGCRK